MSWFDIGARTDKVSILINDQNEGNLGDSKVSKLEFVLVFNECKIAWNDLLFEIGGQTRGVHEVKAR